MLFAPQHIVQKAQQLCIHEGQQILERASRFQGYIVDVNSISEINTAYYKIRRMHGQATHVMCAYRLTACNGPVNQDCVDDGEHSASQNLLDYLKKQELLNTAVFVVRYFGGAKIGATRFQCIVNAAKSAYETMVNTSFDQAEAEANADTREQQAQTLGS